MPATSWRARHNRSEHQDRQASAKGIKCQTPQQHLDTIGTITNVSETEHEGKQAPLIVMERAAPNEGTVLELSKEVLKPVEETRADGRISALESEINKLKLILFSSES